MDCPDCGGPMWDNRAKKESGQYKASRSDYSCKDKDGCGKGVWLEKKGASFTPPARNGGANGTQATTPKRPLGALYYQCMKVAQATVASHIGDTATAADVIAATATLFIAAANSGAPVITPKKSAAPPPPPPPKPPEAEPDDEEDDLPF